MSERHSCAYPFLFLQSKQPRGESRKVSINEEVSEVISVVNRNEEVAYVDNVDSATSLAADQSNVIMEDTSEQAFVAQDVMHDDISLIVNVCDNSGVCITIPEKQCGQQADSALDHSNNISCLDVLSVITAT